jgi:sensor histidine kinase YesM
LFSFSDYVVTNLVGFSSFIFTEYISTLLATIFGTAIYIVHFWILSNIINTKKELINKQRELDFLRQQISPHFLLNALNNVYGTALTSPQLVANKLLELSDLLKYQLETIKKDWISVDEEMKFIETYFNYNNDRINNLTISNTIEGNYESMRIPPLLFLPIIENAIKYSKETDHPFIRSTWYFGKDCIGFTIENNYLKVGSKEKGTKIGIENLKNRLKIMNLEYDLKIDTTIDNICKTEFKLWGLNTNV